MYQVLQEVTKWDFPNHIYVLNSAGKAVAFCSKENGWKIFKIPYMFEKTRRSFKRIDVELPSELLNREDDLPVGAIKVEGSRGAMYIVHNGTCTCSGFRWKGKCKHLKLLKMKGV
jgi:hypothetical protein